MSSQAQSDTIITGQTCAMNGRKARNVPLVDHSNMASVKNTCHGDMISIHSDSIPGFRLISNRNMATRPSVAQPPTAKRRFEAGLASGLACAALFNPWDRALFLSVIESRAFLSPSNFRQPFQGLGQTLVHRTVSNGL